MDSNIQAVYFLYYCHRKDIGRESMNELYNPTLCSGRRCS